MYLLKLTCQEQTFLFFLLILKKTTIEYQWNQSPNTFSDSGTDESVQNCAKFCNLPGAFVWRLDVRKCQKSQIKNCIP